MVTCQRSCGWLSVVSFEKRRAPAEPGSIPDALGMFPSEVRFYREVAPALAGVVRVPACSVATLDDDGSTHLVLEDLSGLSAGGDPVAVARSLRSLHDAFAGAPVGRWPWLRRPGTAAELIATLYDRTWTEALAPRADLPTEVRWLGDVLVDKVALAERLEGLAGPPALCHGDPSARNVFTADDGEIVFVDWEDVRSASGVVDLAWLLVSSVAPGEWDDVIAAYGLPEPAWLQTVLPAAAAQGLLSLAGCEDEADRAGWESRLSAVGARL